MTYDRPNTSMQGGRDVDVLYIWNKKKEERTFGGEIYIYLGAGPGRLVVLS